MEKHAVMNSFHFLQYMQMEKYSHCLAFCYKVSCQFQRKEILITTVTFGSDRRIGIFLANSENNSHF